MSATIRILPYSQKQQTDVYYGVLLATQASRFHIVSVPVDVGIRYPRKPQDMGIERWLIDVGSYGTQNVVNLANNFKTLPIHASKDCDRRSVYTLVIEPQVRLSTKRSFMYCI